MGYCRMKCKKVKYKNQLTYKGRMTDIYPYVLQQRMVINCLIHLKTMVNHFIRITGLLHHYATTKLYHETKKLYNSKGQVLKNIPIKLITF